MRRAQALGLAARGVADHDTQAGNDEALAEGGRVGVEVVPAVEINTDYQGREVHILGYYVDRTDARLLGLLAHLREAREDRLGAILRRLEACGLPLERARVLEMAGDATVGRPHVARAMVERGYVSNVHQAFDRYLATGRPGYVQRYRLTPEETVAAITGAGGVPVFAHPGLAGHDELIAGLCAVGLLGLEAYYPEHSAADTIRYLQLARERGLLVTGGSDCHGPSADHPPSMGAIRVPYEVVVTLKRAAGSRGGDIAG